MSPSVLHPKLRGRRVYVQTQGGHMCECILHGACKKGPSSSRGMSHNVCMPKCVCVRFQEKACMPGQHVRVRRGCAFDPELRACTGSALKCVSDVWLQCASCVPNGPFWSTCGPPYRCVRLMASLFVCMNKTKNNNNAHLCPGQ